MDILEQLGSALGLASLSGLNLYLTVLLTGVAVDMDWVHLAEQHHALAVLGHPAVLTVAGVLFVVQFVADKIPWVDSIWDAFHTFIRPVGACLLAFEALGHVPPHVKVIAALLAGGAALTTHSAKAGVRLVANHSPEPVSNIMLSLAEDAMVCVGTALVLLKPVIAFFAFLVILIGLWMVIPKLWRVLRQTVGRLGGLFSGRRLQENPPPEGAAKEISTKV